MFKNLHNERLNNTMSEIKKCIESREFLDNLYGFAYKRTNNSHEAEDLCSDILVAIIKAEKKNTLVQNVHSFVWTIAHRVYADYCEKRKKHTDRFVCSEFSENIGSMMYFPTDEIIEREEEKEQLKSIIKQICFLSRIYREVVVLYYIDDCKVSQIAEMLNISENAVKQRLFSARSVIKGGVKNMNVNTLTLKPVDIIYIGSGNPMGNDPRVVAERSFSKNLIYLCKDTPRSVKELSELLGVPMPFVEEEVKIQVAGQNGYYGLLRETENGKYISNCIIVDYDVFTTVSEMYKRNTEVIVNHLDAFIKENETELLNAPFLNKNKDLNLITWLLVPEILWNFCGVLEKNIEENYLHSIEKRKHEYNLTGIACQNTDSVSKIYMYGCNGSVAKDISGYKEVRISNLSGRRIKAHFYAAHNISQDPLILLTLKAMDGLAIAKLSEQELETAAKAIEVGYLYKENNILYPKVLVSKECAIMEEMVYRFVNEVSYLVGDMSKEMNHYIKKYVPKHLMSEYMFFIELVSGGFLDTFIERCMDEGILIPPKNGIGSEGVLLKVFR